MGYFSRLALSSEYVEDRSYPSPQMQLALRIEDLESRLSELSENLHNHNDGSRLSLQEIKYADPKFFSRAEDIIKAIEAAKCELSRAEAEHNIKRRCKKEHKEKQSSTEGLGFAFLKSKKCVVG